MASVRDPSTRAAARADDYAEQVGERPVFPTAAYVTGQGQDPGIALANKRERRRAFGRCHFGRYQVEVCLSRLKAS
jgi:hypothetical protein